MPEAEGVHHLMSDDPAVMQRGARTQEYPGIV